MNRIICLCLLCLSLEAALKAEEHNSNAVQNEASKEGGLPSEAKQKTDEESKEKKKETKKPEKEPAHRLTGSITLISDYRSRGISQTMRWPAVQGEFKYTHSSGFYFKSWASNVDGTSHFINNTSLEWDLYLGVEHQLWQTPLKYDIGFLYYYYPGGKAPVPRGVAYNYIEYYIGLGYKGFNIKFYQTIDDYAGINSHNPPTNWETGRLVRPNGHSYGSPYIEANFEWSPYAKWKASLHVGYQAIVNYPQLNYADWQVGLTYEFDWFDIALYYVATNARRDFYDVPDNAFKPTKRHLGAPAWVLGVTRSFK